MNKTMTTALLALALAGCASRPSDEELAHPSYGGYPSDAQALIKGYYARTLKDPESAIYKSFSQPLATYFKSAFQDTKWGWRVCVTMNAKNSYGGYVGYTTDAFMIRDDQVTLYIKDANLGGPQAVCR